MMEFRTVAMNPVNMIRVGAVIYEVDPLAIHFDVVPKCADMVSRLLYDWTVGQGVKYWCWLLHTGFHRTSTIL